jgi:hypothetical protein
VSRTSQLEAGEQAMAGNTILNIGAEHRMAIERRPKNSVAAPAVIPGPTVKLAAVRTLVSRAAGDKAALVKVIGHRVVDNQALAIAPAVEQTEAVEEAAIAAETEARHQDRDLAAAPLVGDPAV